MHRSSVRRQLELELELQKQMLSPVARHAFYHSALHDPSSSSIDNDNNGTDVQRRHLVDALFDLHAPGAAFAVHDTIAAADRRDPDIDRRRDEFRAAQRNIHDHFSSRVHVVAPVAAIDVYADVSAVNTLVMARACDAHMRVLHRMIVGMDDLAARGAIVPATAAVMRIPPDDLARYITPDLPPARARNLSMALRTLECHDPNDDDHIIIIPDHSSSSSYPSSSILHKRLSNSLAAYNILDDLATEFRLRPEKISPQRLIDAILTIHDRLTEPDRYPLRDDGTHGIIVPFHYRTNVVGSRACLYCHPENIPAQMLAFAKLAIDLIKTSSSSSSSSSTIDIIKTSSSSNGSSKHTPTHPAVIAAWLHHQIVSIHPMNDGNGRLARFFAALPLMVTSDIFMTFRGGDDRASYHSAVLASEGIDLDDPPLVQRPRELIPLIEVIISHTEQSFATVLWEDHILKFPSSSVITASLPASSPRRPPASPIMAPMSPRTFSVTDVLQDTASSPARPHPPMDSLSPLSPRSAAEPRCASPTDLAFVDGDTISEIVSRKTFRNLADRAVVKNIHARDLDLMA